MVAAIPTLTSEHMELDVRLTTGADVAISCHFFGRLFGNAKKSASSSGYGIGSGGHG